MLRLPTDLEFPPLITPLSPSSFPSDFPFLLLHSSPSFFFLSPRHHSSPQNPSSSSSSSPFFLLLLLSISLLIFMIYLDQSQNLATRKPSNSIATKFESLLQGILNHVTEFSFNKYDVLTILSAPYQEDLTQRRPFTMLTGLASSLLAGREPYIPLSPRSLGTSSSNLPSSSISISLLSSHYSPQLFYLRAYETHLYPL